MSAQPRLQSARRAYVALMMAIIARGLIAGARSDAEIRREFAGFRTGYRFAMTVYPDGPSFMLRVLAGGQLRQEPFGATPADLCIRFKHIEHAFLVFSFQEGTARAFANDRMVADGEVSDAIRLVRCLNRMEKLILPKLIASRAVKDYGSLSLGEKIAAATRIYARLVGGFLRKPLS